MDLIYRLKKIDEYLDGSLKNIKDKDEAVACILAAKQWLNFTIRDLTKSDRELLYVLMTNSYAWGADLYSPITLEEAIKIRNKFESFFIRTVYGRFFDNCETSEIARSYLINENK